MSTRYIPKILSIATLIPPYSASQEQMIKQALEWVGDFDRAFQSKVERIFRQSDVDQRYTVLPLHEIFKPMSLEEKNDIYRAHIVDYAAQVLQQALANANLQVSEVDCLITTSCTGHMSPSLDAFLINRLGMRADVQRLPVMEMGCIGAAVGLIYAENYLRAYPGRKVALISAELTSITFQREDFSWANIVSTAIFGDGIACAILGDSIENRPGIVCSRMHHFPETTNLLGFNLCNTGFKMVLDPQLPTVIRTHFHTFMEPLLVEAGWEIGEIEHYIVHPGGKKILHNLDILLRKTALTDKKTYLEDSRTVLREMGNMSSATLLFILKRFLDKPIPAGEKALLLGFGPGLTASSLLLEWA
jgi:alkylresorcinol/alkylpyrone synthase